MAARPRILVVGHGPIGHAFIEKMVDRSANCEIHVLCEEPRPAYNRVKLTEYFKDRDGAKKDKMALSYWSEADLNKNQVKLVYGRATAIDRDEKAVTYQPAGSAENVSLSYDTLVLVTGSFCFVPPIPGFTVPEKKNPEWPDDPASRPIGVFVYRTIEDLEAIIQAAKNAKRAAVIGGGLLGLEAAKAVYDLKLESHVLEMAPYLMPTQLNEEGGTALCKKIATLGVHVHVGVKIQEAVLQNGAVTGLRIVEKGADEPTVLPVDMVVVSCGIRPRDELARACGLDIGARGGVKVDRHLRSSDASIYALGEVASVNGMCYGLWAPGSDQAEVLVENLTSGETQAEYIDSDLSTKLKLMGVDVASFGRTAAFWMERQYTTKGPEVRTLEFANELDGVYRKLVFTVDGTKLLGGILVGDARDYAKLLKLSKKDSLDGAEPLTLLMGKNIASSSGPVAAVDGGDGTGLAADDCVCTCLAVDKAQVVKAIEEGATTIPQIKKCTKAGTGCGGCCTPVGEIPLVLAATLKKLGKALPTGICPHFKYSRRELFDIVKVKNIRTFEEALEQVGTGPGCEVCKPILASIMAGLWNDSVLRDGRDQIQDTNDRFLGNIQKTGTYSVIPRCPGGDITPDELIAIGKTAKKFGLWTKITGAQRMGMFGAPMHNLPAIWKELVDAGLESGHAYGKALRTVKSCVGTSWCRYGQQDSVTMACDLENRYKGLRMPHKLKMAASGCLRECAEARGKDVGVIATKAGYNLYVCGNGGAKPKHALLLAADIDEATVLKYVDRFLAFYMSTAKHLQRTAPWLEELPGGIEYLKRVVVEDALGICADLEATLQRSIDAYTCEWKEVVYDESLQKKFKQYSNTEETQNTEQIEYIDMRKQRHPNIYSPPDIQGPAKYRKEDAPASWEWYFAGNAADFPTNGGLAMKHGSSEIAVFNLPNMDEPSERWIAVQNVCPHKQARVISRGLVGQNAEGALTLADPIWKTLYNLKTGAGMSNPALNLSTFNARVDASGKVQVQLPPPEELEGALQEQSSKAYVEAGMVAPTLPSKKFASELQAKDLDW